MKNTALWNWLNKGRVLKDVIDNPTRNNFHLFRVVASIMVLYIHCMEATPKLYLRFLGSFTAPIFFFLSGMLVFRSFETSSSVKNFIWKRLLRIYPAAFVVITLCALVMGPIITTYSLHDYFTDPVFFQNILSVFLIRMHTMLPGVLENSKLHSSSLNASLWTLPLELKLYAFAVLFCLLKFSGKNKILISSTFLLILTQTFHTPVEQFIREHLYARFILFPYITAVPMFFLGVLCNAYKNKILIKNYWFFLGVLLYLIAIQLNILSHTIHLLLMIIALGFGSLDVPWLKRITPKGDYSYGIYVFAFPIQQLLANYIIPNQNSFVLFLFTFIITSIMAFVSWHLIEKKAISYKRLVN